MIPGSLHHGSDAAVSNGEPLAGQAVEIRFALRRPIEGGIADQDRLFGLECRGSRRDDHDFPARQSLPQVIVRFPFEPQRHPLGQKGAEGLTRRPGKGNGDRIGR